MTSRGKSKPTKARVREWLEQRFFLRMHMTIILTGTFLTGVVTTRVLMNIGMNVLALRYAVAISLAYLVFLGLVKLWLMYVHNDGDSVVDVEDAVDIALDVNYVPPLHLSGGGSSSGGGGGDSFDMDLGGDIGDLVIMVVIFVIVLLLGGLAIYFIWTAPALLSEAAFEALLAASIAKRAKKAEGSGWLRVIFRATVWPFLGVLALSVFLGWLAQNRCPDAVKLRDAISCGD